MIRLRKRSSRMSQLFALAVILSLLLCCGGTGIAFGVNDNDTVGNNVYGGDNDGRNYSSISVFEPEIDAAAECDWVIDKSVDPTAITLSEDNSFSEDATYTIQVTQGGLMYTIAGSVEVECDNTNDNPAEIDKVWIEIRDGNGYDGDLIYEEELTEYSGEILINGDPPAEFDFNIQFTDEDHSYGSDPLPDGLKFIVRVNIVNISPGKDADDQPYKNQADIEWEWDCYETVTVVDDMEEVDDIDVTFSPEYNGGIWEDVTCDQDPITYTATFSGTVPGEYTVDNTATIEETEDSDDASVDITVEGDQDPETGTIIVEKVVKDKLGNIIENDEMDFDVEIDPAYTVSAVADVPLVGQLPSYNGTVSVGEDYEQTVEPGCYWVEETPVPDGYTLVSYESDDENDGPVFLTNGISNGDEIPRPIMVCVEAGETVTVTITNEFDPNLIIEKVVIGDEEDNTEFGVTVGNGEVDDDERDVTQGSPVIIYKNPGSYFIKETTIPSDYNFVRYETDAVEYEITDDGIWVYIGQGETVTVTVFNDKDDGPPPSDDDTELIIEKDVTNRSGDGTEFDIEVARYVDQKGDNYYEVIESIDLSENDGQYVIDLDDSELGPGTYFVREVQDDMPSRYRFVGYRIDGASADDNEDGWIEVEVDEGDSVVVTVENRRRSSGGGDRDRDDDEVDEDTPTFTEPETEEPEIILPEPVVEEVPTETEPVLVGPLPKTGENAFPFVVLGFLVTLGGAVVVFRRI